MYELIIVERSLDLQMHKVRTIRYHLRRTIIEKTGRELSIIGKQEKKT